MPRPRSSNPAAYGRDDYSTFTAGGLMEDSLDTQVGAAMIGKAEVDCRCRWSEAQWGSLNKTPLDRALDQAAPAGILYNDITIRQPLTTGCLAPGSASL